MKNFLPQLTDTQLTNLGWTAGQIKEVRRYLKLSGFERNAHQRALCRRYSDAQRVVTPVTPEPRFTGGKKVKVKAARSPKTRVNWTYDEVKLIVDLYLRYVDPAQGIRNRIVIREEFAQVYPERTSINLTLSTIAGLDTLNPAEGHGPDAGSALLREVLHSVDPVRFAV